MGARSLTNRDYAIVHEDGASTPADFVLENHGRANLDILVDALTPEDAMARVARALTLLANSRP